MYCHQNQMPDFKAKMHQIQFRLGLRPRPRCELTALPQAPWLDLGTLLLRKRRKEKREGGKENGERREGRRKDERDGRPQILNWP